MMAVPVALGIYMKFDNRNWILYQLVEKLLRQPSASLRGARFLAYLFDMSRSLRAVRLASGRLATFFNKLLRLRLEQPGLNGGAGVEYL